MIDKDEIRQQMERKENPELISILLEHDEAQWQPEVFEIVGAILAQRGIDSGKGLKVVSGAEDARDMTEGLNLVTVAEYFNYLEAETDRITLEGEGLKAWVFHEEDPLAEGIPPGVQLKVLAEDWKAAMEKLRAEISPSTDLPDEIAEPPCPRCGSRKVAESAEIVEGSTASGKHLQKQEWLYHCADCGLKWNG
jgi:hypothetical protein